MRDVQTLPLPEAVRRRLLTFVLLAVLVWYTVVVPAPPGALYVRRAGGGPSDAEERDAGQVAAPQPDADMSVDELDWPEFIDG